MKPMIYLWKTTFKNQVKMSLRKPANLLVVIIVMAYFVMILGSFSMIASDKKIQSVDMAPVLGFFAAFYSPLNLATYARRKGIAFKKCDVNLLFTAPLPPKLIMLFAKVRSVWGDILISLFVFLAGIIIFHISLWKMLVYFLFTTVVKQVLESSLVLILYTSETLTKRQRKLISIGIYVILAAFLLSVAIYILTHNLEVLSARKIMENEIFQMVPLIGWNVAFIFLLFSKATMINVIGSVLYLLTALVLFVIAGKMKCEGEYYEDAMKFADDYEEALKKSKKGEATVIGKKKKYLHKTIEYKGTGAKAIFYRQLLEYKKNRYFIFGLVSVLYLIFGVGIGIGVKVIPEFTKMQEFKCLILPGVIAYIAFLTSGYRTKWAKELEQPLTFLIPDSAIRKLWYATLVEHIRGICNGLFITIPAAVGMELEPIYAVLSILCCVLLNAGKVYTELLARFISGKNAIGFICTILKLLFQGVLVVAGVVGAVLGGIFTGFTQMLPVMIGMNVALFVIAFIMALISSILFERMDYAE